MSKRLILIIMAGAFLCLPLASAWADMVRIPTEVAYYIPTGSSSAYNGVNLFTPIQQNNAATGKTITFLIDMDGRPVHFWTKNSMTETVWDARLESNGNLSRECVPPKPAGADPTNVMQGSSYGGCGAIEEVDWSGNVQWRYLAYNAQFRQHDDYLRIYNKALGQYTYLFIAWVPHTQADAVNNGATGTVPANWSLDAIYEVNSAGTIVWMWSFFDHLCQNANATLPNYFSNLSSATGKFNINAVSTTRTAPTVDWMHCTSIGYNEANGYVVINSREFNEFFIIDHDGTFVDTSNFQNNITAAASATGDFKYRFGNPYNYNAGSLPSLITNASNYLTMTNGTVQIWGAHGVSFIPANAWGHNSGPALNNPGNVLLFDNHGCNGQPLGFYSQAMEVNPKISAWSAGSGFTIGTAYLASPGVGYITNASNLGYSMDTSTMSKQVYWRYIPGSVGALYSAHLGSVQRLPNNNTLICSGESGHFVEVTYAWTLSEATGGSAPALSWEYSNPMNNGVPWKYNLNNGQDGGYQVDRAYRYDLDHPAFAGHLSLTGSWGSTYSIVTTPSEPGTNGTVTLAGSKPLPPGSGGLTAPSRAIPATYTVAASGDNVDTVSGVTGTAALAPTGTSTGTVIRR